MIAIGLYDPYSPIRIKVLLNGGHIQVDDQFFIGKVTSAYKIREQSVLNHTDAYRLIYGENDGLPGFICDVYKDVAVIKLYSTIWLPYLESLTNAIVKVSNAKTVVLRMSRMVNSLPLESKMNLQDGDVIYGNLENEETIISEHNTLFHVNVIKGHKTGYFLDHRFNRNKVGNMSMGKDVLDVFSYAGGFSAHAGKGGARSVTSIDISKQAIELSKKNMKLNQFAGEHFPIAGDAFVEMEKLIAQHTQYDIVVVDPPSFDKSNDDIAFAKKSYQRLAKYAIRLVRSGGICVMASCSSRITKEEFFDLIESGFYKAQGTSFSLLEKTFHDEDHHVNFKEGWYLKTGYWKIK